MLDKFEDVRLHGFGKKIIYQESPETLPQDMFKNLKREIAKRILSEKKEKWWTCKEFYYECDNLRDKYTNANDEKKLKFLDELNEFVMSIQKKYENIFEECKNTKNVNYLGFVENNKIIELLKNMHIYSFPSIWPETSCISAIEAMAAGCEIVTSNLGALYETCAPFATFVGFASDFDNFEKKYQKALENSVKNFWSKENQKKIRFQQEVINLTYSWNVRSKEWISFLEEARRLKA